MVEGRRHSPSAEMGTGPGREMLPATVRTIAQRTANVVTNREDFSIAWRSLSRALSDRGAPRLTPTRTGPRPAFCAIPFTRQRLVLPESPALPTTAPHLYSAFTANEGPPTPRLSRCVEPHQADVPPDRDLTQMDTQPPALRPSSLTPVSDAPVTRLIGHARAGPTLVEEGRRDSPSVEMGAGPGREISVLPSPSGRRSCHSLK